MTDLNYELAIRIGEAISGVETLTRNYGELEQQIEKLSDRLVEHGLELQRAVGEMRGMAGQMNSRLADTHALLQSIVRSLNQEGIAVTQTTIERVDGHAALDGGKASGNVEASDG